METGITKGVAESAPERSLGFRVVFVGEGYDQPKNLFRTPFLTLVAKAVHRCQCSGTKMMPGGMPTIPLDG